MVTTAIRGMSAHTLLELIQAVGSTAVGMTARVALRPGDSTAGVREWCERGGNYLVATGPGWVAVRRGRAGAPAPQLVSRVWIYTNFDCNLSCDYCCVRSAPGISRRELGLERIESIASEAQHLGIQNLLLTGGEPFLLPYIDRAVLACVAAAPTTLLTNAMLFRGRRRALLEAMPRDGFALQISLDSPDPSRHDRHRGAGSWLRAVDGITIARGAGFRVRVAATVGLDPDRDERDEERDLHALLDQMGIPREDRVIRRVARRGRADRGVVLTTEGLIPEVTYTDRGAYWHPVGADDPDMLIAAGQVSLPEVLDLVRARLEARIEQEEEMASVFPCA
jgi:pyruvate-formate lyase-activating enzyme